jgi:RHS repeat-associated protein
LKVDSVKNMTYTPNIINQNGVAYIDNKEYNKFNEYWGASISISLVHNTEGYVQYGTPPNSGFIYYRTDHLGNNREVWRASSKATIQRTQYYASGLPWETTPADNLSLQPYKYNGKEFVEMHGYDTYDYGARGYYAAMGRFMTVDPLAEKYYSISPYAYCAGNPVRYIDLKGMDLFDVTGHFIPGGDNSNRVLVRTNNGNVPLSSLAMNNMSNRQTAANIAGYYGNQIGIHSPGNIGVSNEPIENSSNSQAFISGKNIYLNAKGGLNRLLDDKNNLKNSLFHEKDHKDLGQGEKETSNLTHAGVYLDQMGDKSFENTTSDFKNQTTGAFKGILNDAIIYDGAQDSQIQGLVDQFNKLNTGYQISYKRTGADTSSYKLTVTQNK